MTGAEQDRARSEAIRALSTCPLPAAPFAVSGRTSFYRLHVDQQIPAAFPDCSCAVCAARRDVDPDYVAMYDALAVADGRQWPVHYPVADPAPAPKEYNCGRPMCAYRNGRCATCEAP